MDTRNTTPDTTAEAGRAAPDCSRFFIVNTTDRPCEDHLAEKRSDGKFYYVHPRLKNVKAHWGMTPERPTPIEAFGVRVMPLHGMLYGEYDSRMPKTATYSDGRSRKWQGATSFQFRFQNDQVVATAPPMPIAEQNHSL